MGSCSQSRDFIGCSQTKF